MMHILSRPLTTQQILRIGCALEMGAKVLKFAVIALFVLLVLFEAATVAVAFMPGGPAWRVVHGVVR